MSIYDTYRVVLTFHYANGPLEVESQPMSREKALAHFDSHISAGGFGRGRSAKVISEASWLESQASKESAR